MSGQYPTGFNSPANFGNQMNNSMGNQMRNQQMNMNMNMGMPNQMGMMNTQMNFNQPGLMQQPSQTPQSQPMQSPNMGLGSSNLSHGSEMGHVSPQHQMQQQVGQQQQPSMCLETPTAPNPGNVSNIMIRSLGNAPGQQSQPQPNQQQQQQQKEFNIVSLCRFGQETVQDIAR